jgi:hypothetical protein
MHTGGRGASGGHGKGIAAALMRKRKERHSDIMARTERHPRVNTDRRPMASGPPGRQAYRVVHMFSWTDTRVHAGTHVKHGEESNTE